MNLFISTDSFQREPQTAEPVSLSQCGETSDKGATNETNTNITQKSAGDAITLINCIQILFYFFTFCKNSSFLCF